MGERAVDVLPRMSTLASKAPVIALDVMGGDAGVADVLAAAEIASERYPRLTFRLHGPEAAIRAELPRCPRLAATAVVIHSDDVIQGSDMLQCRPAIPAH